MRDQFRWARTLSFVTGLVNQELLLRNEYSAAENRILRAHLPARLRWSDAERSSLGEIAKRLGRKALQEIARVGKPDTLLACRQLMAHKFDGSGRRGYPGRPRLAAKSYGFMRSVWLTRGLPEIRGSAVLERQGYGLFPAPGYCLKRV
jgi:hypothetical protein